MSVLIAMISILLLGLEVQAVPSPGVYIQLQVAANNEVVVAPDNDQQKAQSLEKVLDQHRNKELWIGLKTDDSEKLGLIINKLKLLPQALTNSYLVYEVSGDGSAHNRIVEELPEIRRLRVDQASAQACLNNFKPGASLPADCDALDLFVTEEQAKALAPHLGELREKLQALPVSSRLFIGSPPHVH